MTACPGPGNIIPAYGDHAEACDWGHAIIRDQRNVWPRHHRLDWRDPNLYVFAAGVIIARCCNHPIDQL